MQAKKILIITNIPNAYRIPLFNQINKEFQEKGIQVKVIFGTKGFSRIKTVVDLTECKFDYQFLRSINFPLFHSEKMVCTYSGLYKILRQYNPDKTITIGYSIATMKLWFRSFFIKTPYIIWSGSILAKGKKDSFFRKIQRKMLLKKAVGAIAYGTKAKEYFRSLGMATEKITIAINTVDTLFFEQETKKAKETITPDTINHLTYVGYLTSRKNVQNLLDVVVALSLRRKDFVLDIIGDGKEKKKLQQFVRKNHISDFVTFYGFKQKKELPFFLAQSNCFLFQTDFDIWGLVLNEAMSAEIPCIASINAGAVYDLIQEGVTGFSVDFSDTLQSVKKINWLLDHPEEAKTIGKNASKYIKDNVGLINSTSGFIKAIQFS